MFREQIVCGKYYKQVPNGFSPEHPGQFSKSRKAMREHAVFTRVAIPRFVA
jgi:hypothetical protein